MGKKADLVLEWKIFNLVFIILNFSEFPGPPPPSKILRTLLVEYTCVLKRVTDGGLGAEPPTAGGYGDLGAKPQAAGQSPQNMGDFCVFGKTSYFNPTGSHFARVHSHLKELDF